MFFYRHFFIVLLVVILSSCSGTTDCKYDVKETKVTREEFLEAYHRRPEYNLVADTAVNWPDKKRIEYAVFCSLKEEEKERYIWDHLEINNIHRYPTGEYVAGISDDVWMYKEVFLNDKFEPDTTVIEGAMFAVYSTSGIYAGCESFDCDSHALFHFYSNKGSEKGRMEEIAFYKNINWRLEWFEMFPELEGIDHNQCVVWYKDALYCAAQENCYDENGNWFTRPYFVKLELVKNK